MDDSRLRSSLQRDRRRSDTCKHSHFGSENRHRRCKRFEWMAALGGSSNDRRGHYPASSPTKNAPPEQNQFASLENTRRDCKRALGQAFQRLRRRCNEIARVITCALLLSVPAGLQSGLPASVSSESEDVRILKH